MWYQHVQASLAAECSPQPAHISCAQGCTICVGGHNQGLQAGTEDLSNMCLGSIQGQFEWDFEQPGLVGGNPAHGRAVGTGWSNAFSDSAIIL